MGSTVLRSVGPGRVSYSAASREVGLADAASALADPQRTRPGETNTEHGGRGVYLLDPSGHYLELTTRPYL